MSRSIFRRLFVWKNWSAQLQMTRSNVFPFARIQSESLGVKILSYTCISFVLVRHFLAALACFCGNFHIPAKHRGEWSFSFEVKTQSIMSKQIQPNFWNNWNSFFLLIFFVILSHTMHRMAEWWERECRKDKTIHHISKILVTVSWILYVCMCMCVRCIFDTFK